MAAGAARPDGPGGEQVRSRQQHRDRSGHPCASDGYTLAAVTSANAINATISKRMLTFDFLKDLAPVAGLAQGPSVMVVHPSVPANSVAEFIAYARANPGKINMGTPGVGTTGH